jgi:antitoxin PrlF
MAKKGKSGACCSNLEDESTNCCRVESIVSVDDRGQMVLPKDIREKAGIKAGDKLALVTSEKNGRVCCIYLFRAEELAEKARSMLGPLAKEMS